MYGTLVSAAGDPLRRLGVGAGHSRRGRSSMEDTR